MAKIIFIEDETEINLFLIDVLKELGHEIEIAETSKRAENKLKENSYNLVVLDILLPDKKDPDAIPLIERGVRILRGIREGRFRVPASVPVLVITAVPEREVRGKIKDFLSKEGKGDMLEKPFTAGTFEKKVRELLGEEDG